MTASSSRRVAQVGAVITALGALALAAVAPRPQIDNSVDALLASGDSRAEAYERFRARFGTDDVVVVRIEGGEPSTFPALVREATERLAADPIVHQVISAASIHADAFDVLLEPELGGFHNLAELEWTFDGPLDRALALYSPREPSATLYGLAAPSPPEDRARLSQTLEALRARARSEARAFAYSGPPFLNFALDQAGRHTQTRTVPLLLLVSIGLLFAAVRSVRLSLLLFLPVSLGGLAADGLLGLAGQSTNLVVDIAKPLLFVLLLAGGIHVAGDFRDRIEHGASRAAAAWGAARARARAICWALATTSIGFGSLALSEVPPIRTFGLVTAAGLALGVPILLLALPGLLAAFGPSRFTAASNRAALVSVALFGQRMGLARPRTFVALGILVIAAGAAALPTLETEPHAIRYFSKADPIRRDYEHIEATGHGLATLEAVLTATSSLVRSGDSLARLYAFAKDASALEGVTAVVDPSVLLTAAHYELTRREGLPDPSVAAQVLTERPEAAAFVTDGGKTVRVAILIQTLDADQLDRLSHEVSARFAVNFGDRAELELTGSYALLLRAQRALLSTLHRSLYTTAILMQVALLFGLGSLRTGLAAVIPNLFPVAVNLVVMRTFGLPLDLGTSMTAAIALGIAVDSTFHYALAWKRVGPAAAATETGRAIVLSTCVVGAGFFALVTADFIPTRSFGLLCGTAMFTALFADLVILPPLLAFMTPKRPPSNVPH